MLEVGDPAALEVVVDVLSSDAVQLQPSMKVFLERWGGETLNGVIRRIEPVGFTRVSALGVDEQRVTVVVDITSPTEAWTRLGDGYRLEANFYFGKTIRFYKPLPPVYFDKPIIGLYLSLKTVKRYCVR